MSSCPFLLGLLLGWCSESTFWETESGAVTFASSQEEPGEATPKLSSLLDTGRQDFQGEPCHEEDLLCASQRGATCSPCHHQPRPHHTSEATKIILIVHMGKLTLGDSR